MKKLLSYILSLSFMVSMSISAFSPISYAAGGALVSTAGSQLGPYIGQLIAQGGFADGYIASNYGSLANFLGSSSVNFSVDGNTFNPEFTYNYSPTKNTYFQYDGSGATYNYQYNSNDYR